MSGYENSLVGRRRVMLQLSVTRITDAVILLSVSTIPVLLIAAITDGLGYAVAALLGWAAWLGASVARSIFDAGGYTALLEGSVEHPITDITVGDLVVGVVYTNLVLAVGTALGVLVAAQIGVTAGVVVAMAFVVADTGRGLSGKPGAPIWTLLSVVMARLGRQNTLKRLTDAISMRHKARVSQGGPRSRSRSISLGKTRVTSDFPQEK